MRPRNIRSKLLFIAATALTMMMVGSVRRNMITVTRVGVVAIGTEVGGWHGGEARHEGWVKHAGGAWHDGVGWHDNGRRLGWYKDG